MTSTTTTNFLGIPVDGDIVRGDKRTAQRPLDEFAPILQAVLDDPTVAEFGWRQYTPYFNDGDPCVFSGTGVWVRLTTTDPYADTDSLDVKYGDGHLGKRPIQWNGRQEVDLPYEGTDEARYDRCVALSDAVESGAFDDVLLDAFGDHAEVTVSRSGIKVEFYEHD